MAHLAAVVNSPLYVVIDLGSNSFHMLIARQLGSSVQVVEKIKRKVRLASGLDENNYLSESMIEKGLSCLRFFAQRLASIPPENVRLVATATLRLAKNSQVFIKQAEEILAHKLVLLSGIDEAKTIYLGVAHTTFSEDKRFVIDIGGASTELVIGDGFAVKKALSLDMGCVTFNQQFFSEQRISKERFHKAVDVAKNLITPTVGAYKKIGWQCVLGRSGIMQALADILIAEQKMPVISLQFLQQMQEKVLQFEHFSAINIIGLTEERSPVFVSGLAILTALFEQFTISQLTLADGALREGLLYDMIPQCHQNIRQQTLSSLQQRYHLDQRHSEKVRQQTQVLYQQAQTAWSLTGTKALNVLLAACQLFEIGIAITYKNHQHHSEYILRHADLIGFDMIERKLLILLVKCYQGGIDETLMFEIENYFPEIKKLLVILRVAIILSDRSFIDNRDQLSLLFTNNSVEVVLPEVFLQSQTLVIDLLTQEQDICHSLGMKLIVTC